MKTIVITGTSRGIGHALAKKFIEENYHVIGTSTTGKININYPNFDAVKLDLSNSSSISQAVSNINKKISKIDILFNNAGINIEQWDDTKVDLKILRKTLEVNLFGLIDFTEKLLEKISTPGQVINSSSILGSLSDEDEDSASNPSYRISKTALNMYTKTLAARLIDNQITVSSIHPGWVKTDMGGEDAPREISKAADEIFKFATTPHPSGLFWYDYKQIPW